MPFGHLIVSIYKVLSFLKRQLAKPSPITGVKFEKTWFRIGWSMKCYVIVLLSARKHNLSKESLILLSVISMVTIVACSILGLISEGEY